jgi:hypothetical protein
MRLVRVVMVVATSALVACSIPEKTLQGPFDCQGEPLPTTADDLVTVSGDVEHLLAGKTVPNALLQAFLTDLGSASALAHTNSASDGSFSISVPTFGKPHSGYLEVTNTGFLTTFLFPAVPVAQSLRGERVQMFADGDFGQLQNLGIMQSESNGLLIVHAIDCNGHELGGAEISIDAKDPTTMAAITPLYLNANIEPAPGATSTDPTTGTAIFANVPTGSVTITAAVPSRQTSLLPNTVTITANAITQADIQP